MRAAAQPNHIAGCDGPHALRIEALFPGNLPAPRTHVDRRGAALHHSGHVRKVIQVGMGDEDRIRVRNRIQGKRRQAAAVQLQIGIEQQLRLAALHEN